MTSTKGELIIDGEVEARACVNIALIKYWGKAPARGPNDANLPACPSLSLTLEGLHSETRVRFAPDADDDRVILDGEPLVGAGLDRMRPVLDHVRGSQRSPLPGWRRNTVLLLAASSASGAATRLRATTCWGSGWRRAPAHRQLGSRRGRSVFEG